VNEEKRMNLMKVGCPNLQQGKGRAHGERSGGMWGKCGCV